MGKPAARFMDVHTCPMVTPGIPPVPHVGGPISGPGCPTVIIGGSPASVMGDMCVCVGPPDTIIMGSLGVLIGGKPAARVTDPTVHGGMVSMVGPSRVLIGDVITSMAKNVFPGQQNFGNCGVQSAQQLINLATGQNIGEVTLLNIAIAAGYALNSTNRGNKGATSTWHRQQLLNLYGVSSSTINSPTKEDIAKAINQKKVMIATAEVAVLWAPTTQTGSHAVMVYDGDYDENGNLTSVYINDTGAGQQGRNVPINTFMQANQADPAQSLNVIDNPVY
jgi:uncharacterized Zn-binding protein involved in type VI secretion